MSEKKDVSEMVGDFLREAAVLVFVFIPIDYGITGTLTLKLVLASGTLSLALLVMGIHLESRR